MESTDDAKRNKEMESNFYEMDTYPWKVSISNEMSRNMHLNPWALVQLGFYRWDTCNFKPQDEIDMGNHRNALLQLFYESCLLVLHHHFEPE